MKYDSTHGKFKHTVSTEGADTLVVNGCKIKCIAATRGALTNCRGEQWVWSMSLSPLASLWRLIKRRATLRQVPRK